MTRYRYRMAVIQWSADPSKLEDALNILGAEGWEALDFRWAQGAHEFVTVAMRLAVEEEPKAAQINESSA